jgi:diguanylate cyclase (GGDEF)-like protein
MSARAEITESHCHATQHSMDRATNATVDAAMHMIDAEQLQALNLVRIPVWVFDIDHHRIHWANHAALVLWRASSLDELQTREMGRDMSATVAAKLVQHQFDFAAHGSVFKEQWTMYPSGKPVPVNMELSGYRLPDGRMAMLCEGYPAEVHSPEQLRSVEALLHTPMMISLYRLDGTPLYRNPAARASVHCFDEPMSSRFVDTQALAQLIQQVERKGLVTLTMAVNTTAGTRWHEVSARCGKDAVTGEDTILLSEVNVSALKDSEAKASFLSEHDVLTGLPNRTRLQNHFKGLTAPPNAASRQIAMILIDLDRFKDINDTWGHAAGDKLLTEVAARLNQTVRHGDLVARFGGDEFVILLNAVQSREDIDRVYARVREVMTPPVALPGTAVHVSATFGVSLYPEHGDDFDTLLRHADLAMYSGKSAGRNTLEFYECGMSESLQARKHLEDELRLALARREFQVHYQPRVSRQGHIVGAEALARWAHPERGLVMPGNFITVMEDAGLARALGHQIFEMAAKQQATWAAAGHPLKISVNLSPCEFEDPCLLSDLETILIDAGGDPAMLELEVTESMLISQNDRALEVLKAIQSLGLSIALDDFGTGYSNLAYLQRFPFSTLKIDRAFVQAEPSNRPLAEAIVALCKALDLSPVAEGIETVGQLDWLAGLGVTEYQGFLFSRAVPAPQFEALLHKPDQLADIIEAATSTM